MNLEKPHKGKLYNWCKLPFPKEEWIRQRLLTEDEGGLGYVIFGMTSAHTLRDYKRTSWVVEHDPVTGEIETNNSRYTLVGDERDVPDHMQNVWQTRLTEVEKDRKP